MFIDPKSTVAGLPAIKIRDFLHRAGDGGWTVAYAGSCLSVTESQAAAVVAELVQLGYVEVAQFQHGTEVLYTVTLAGSTLALASAAKSLTRKTSERKITEFLERVRHVNASDYYLYRVRKVLVFGSYLSDKDRINDIDLAVELVHRISDPEQRRAADDARIQEAHAKGRRFSNILVERMWPSYEVLLYLKARSRALSIHSTDDDILKQAQTRVILEDDAAKPLVRSVS
jgi:predicted nucleotidyltransferase